MQQLIKKTLGLVLIIVLTFSPLQADFFYFSPNVSADDGPPLLEDLTITENTTWNSSTDLSRYNNISIEYGATLTIEKGTQLAFRQLQIYGNVIARGTIEEKIKLTKIHPFLPEGGEFDPVCFIEPTGIIEFDGPADMDEDPESVFEFVEFYQMGGYYEFDSNKRCPGLSKNIFRNIFAPTAYAASAANTWPAIKMRSGKVTMKNCTFEGNSYQDIEVDIEYEEPMAIEECYDYCDAGDEECRNDCANDVGRNMQSYLHIENSNFQNNTRNTAVVSKVLNQGRYDAANSEIFQTCMASHGYDYANYWEFCNNLCTNEADNDPSFRDRTKVVLKNNWYGVDSGPSHFISNNNDPIPIGERITGDLSMVDYWRESADFASNVLFLPGIKASRLDSADDDDDQAWLPENDNDIKKLLMKENGESSHNIYAKNVVGTAYAIQGIYDEFGEDLADLKLKHIIRDYFMYAYDWRLDVEDLAKNGTKYKNETKNAITEIDRLAQTSVSQKVTIVAHSNGGLLAKAIVQELEKQDKSNLIDNVVMVSSPQMGTPEAIPALLHGYDQALPYLSKFMDNADSRELTENMPGAYGLLPSEEYFSRNQGSVIDFKTELEPYKKYKDAYGDKIDDYAELQKFLLAKDDQREKPVKEDLVRASVLNERLFSQVKEMHGRIDVWTPPESIKLIQIAGWGLDTIQGMEYTQKKHVECVKAFGLIPKCTETSLFDPIMEPKLTSDGDGTVTAPSSLMLDAGGNVERYWVDLYRYNNPTIDFRADKKHKNILEVNKLLDFLSSIIKTHKSPEVLPQYISSQKPSDYENMKSRIRMSLYSPLDIHLYDQDGNHTGPITDDDGTTIEENIPNTYCKVFGEQKYVGWSTNDNIRVELEGYAEGSYTVELQEVTLSEDGENLGDFTSFENLPTMAGTKVEFEVPEKGLKEMSSLSADYDGDGTENYVVVPKINSSATLELEDDSSDEQDEIENENEVENLSKIEKKEKARIDSWKVYQYKTDDKKCPTKLKLMLTGSRFDDNVSIKIGNKKASNIRKEGNRKIVASFCMQKLLNVKTDLKRTVSATNPNTDKEKARKQIDLNEVLLKIKK